MLVCFWMRMEGAELLEHGRKRGRGVIENAELT